jgi:predicted dehydrogenase
VKIAILGSSGHYDLAITHRETGGPHHWGYCPTELDDMPPETFRTRHFAATQAASLQCFANPEALLERFHPDIAVVNPPFHRTAALTLHCLAKGIPVLAEKPIAVTWPDFRELERLTFTGSVPWAAMLTMRYEGLFSAAQRFVSQGGLGRVVCLNAQKSYPLRGWTQPSRPSFYHHRSTYGGTLPWIGIHLADLFSWFSDSPVRRVSAQHTSLGNQNHGDMEAVAALQLEFASGGFALGEVDFLKPWSTPGEPWGDDRLRVVGEAGVLDIAHGKGVLSLPAGQTPLVPDPPGDLFADFLEWVTNGKPMRMTPEEGLHANRLALLARDAADTHCILEAA